MTLQSVWLVDVMQGPLATYMCTVIQFFSCFLSTEVCFTHWSCSTLHSYSITRIGSGSHPYAHRQDGQNKSILPCSGSFIMCTTASEMGPVACCNVQRRHLALNLFWSWRETWYSGGETAWGYSSAAGSDLKQGHALSIFDRFDVFILSYLLHQFDQTWNLLIWFETYNLTALVLINTLGRHCRHFRYPPCTRSTGGSSPVNFRIGSRHTIKKGGYDKLMMQWGFKGRGPGVGGVVSWGVW